MRSLITLITFVWYCVGDEAKCLLIPAVKNNVFSATCLDDEVSIPYTISIDTGGTTKASDSLLGCELKIQVKGDVASLSATSITTSSYVLKKRFVVFAKKLGTPIDGSISVTAGKCTKAWTCQTIRIGDNHRYWLMDCQGSVKNAGDTLNLYLSGSKPYAVSVVSTATATSAQKPIITVTLIGTDGRRSKDLGLLAGTETPGLLIQKVLRAPDVGAIRSIRLTNLVDTAPWTFNIITIQTEDAGLAKFQGGQYVGAPFDKTLEFINLASNDGASGLSIDTSRATWLECHTRALDIVSGSNEDGQGFKVSCPQGCDNHPASFVAGLGLHPASSSICGSAFVDGYLSPSGGDLLVFLRTGVQLSPTPLISNVSTTKIYPYRQDISSSEASFYILPLDSIDDIVSSVRIVDAFGKLSHTGRLEIRRVNEWGSICTQGETQAVTRWTAVMACRELGYLSGELSDSSCRSAFGFNLCGVSSLPTHAGGVTCEGTENTFGDCLYQLPDKSKCADHSNDLVITCTDSPSDAEPPQGTIRMVDSSGLPAVAGVGRLEMFLSHEWGTICNDGWTREAWSVACREMGYDTLKDLTSMGAVANIDEDICSDLMGSNYCGGDLTKIAASQVTCEGTETKLRECTMEISDDIYCVHTEDVVVGCEGLNGDPSGVGMYKTPRLPSLRSKVARAMTTLTCSDTLKTLILKVKVELPGSLFLVKCPAGCRRQSGNIVGDVIYSPDSPICKAAVHVGVSNDEGASFIAILTHGQTSYSGSLRNSIQSHASATSASMSLIIAPSVADISAKIATQSQLADTNLTKFGYFGDSKLPSNFNDHAQSGVSLSFVQMFRSALGLKTSSPVTTSKTTTTAKKVPTPLVAWCNSVSSPQSFKGGAHDLVTLNYLPNGDKLSTLKSFTLLIKFKPGANTIGKWRSLLSYSECDGFSLAIDPDGQIVFEQLCSPYALYTKIVPKAATWMTLGVSYDNSEQQIDFFTDDKVAYTTTINFPIVWEGVMRAAKSSILEYEPFIGEITSVFIYQEPLIQETSFDLMILAINSIASMCASQSPSPGAPSYSNANYKMCLSKCEAAPSPVAKKLADNIKPGVAVKEVSCTDSLDTRPDLSGTIGTQFHVRCPASCQSSSKPVYRSVYPGSYPICDSVALSNPRAQKIEITLAPGQSSYSPEPILPYNLRSYTAKAFTDTTSVQCNTTTSFVTLKRAVDSYEVYSCPGNCSFESLQSTSEDPAVCQRAQELGFVSRNLGGEVLTQVRLTQHSSFFQRELVYLPLNYGPRCQDVNLIEEQVKLDGWEYDAHGLYLPVKKCLENIPWSTLKEFHCDTAKFSWRMPLVSGDSLYLQFGKQGPIARVGLDHTGVVCDRLETDKIADTDGDEDLLTRTRRAQVRVEGVLGPNTPNLLKVSMEGRMLCELDMSSEVGASDFHRLHIASCNREARPHQIQLQLHDFVLQP
eukprot:Blabericola_migrator_1__5696@NODE_288_length_10293_cov_65_527675_g237_i0_p1_GENE_NODE_288_length_10293_cov_65_527675_g237_i0NODE_288_length_10293_cov_65_527675_g237_i0_p1_ORF_typecomplete_len1450_score326_59LCCL/PF03815_19/5_1e08LCCL/PF03815_19/1_6e20LCCL/PF03815_19/0_0052LCCL/PF03815_19/2e02SRCR/PF00530_18/1_5e12SRCR/PF00530_18/1_4e18Laminin_G_3/PF13385_6/4_5e06SRCR_2/PF15494_6/44SRCR_2/PF15494_6/0_0019Pentaxin/PF00354_17/0_0053_NODE_288_length_10293_cov_65_527675_g237_i031187467